ncbi:MAG TPA: amidophosphoribosyltransferase [Candidatus Saccharimonadales bacterium]|nr:amidophosphoribosyltransferase [Candidatus Saccharimonadales bacterium]
MGAEQKSAEVNPIGEFLDEYAPPGEYDDKPQDECGIVAVYAPGEPVGKMTYEAMQRLQHRGQSGAGMVYSIGPKTLMGHHGRGLIDRAIPEVIPGANGVSPVDAEPTSAVTIGHTRYSTADREDASQPFIGHLSDPSFALAHNGHIETIDIVAERYGIDTTDPASDSSLLTEILDKRAVELGSLEAALHEVTPQLDGGYNLVLTDGERIIGVRDPWGTHPLSLGELAGGKGFALASETVAFKTLDIASVRDVEPGEILVIGKDGVESSHMDRVEPPRQCMFEYGYFTRPDSKVNGVDVYIARKLMGKFLAIDRPVDADVVVGVPNSGLSAAAGFARQSRIPQVLGLFKDEYVGRSFIERAAKRDETLRRKLSPNEAELEGRHIVLVDDSLIKANTMRALVKMVRETGALSVHVRLAMPRYEHPCYGGMDTRETWRLIARRMDDDQIAEEIGADSVGFNSVDRIEQAVREARVDPSLVHEAGRTLCAACTTGDYPYSVPVHEEDTGELDLVDMAATG